MDTLDDTLKSNGLLYSALISQLNILKSNIKTISLTNYVQTIWGVSKQHLTEDIRNLSSLWSIVTRNIQRSCKRLWILRNYLKKTYLLPTGIKIDHCIKIGPANWTICELCTLAEDIMIDLEQVNDLTKFPDEANNNNNNNNELSISDIDKYIECISRMDLHQTNLIYAIKKIYNIYSATFMEQEEEKYRSNEDTCSICIGKLTNDIKLECTHKYCADCISDHITAHVAKYNNYHNILCPLCRRPIKPNICSQLVIPIIVEEEYSF